MQIVRRTSISDRIERQRRWVDFLRFARQHQPPRWIFRGQRQHWALKPSVGRSGGYNAARELQLFNEFRRLSNPMVDRSQMTSDWDWLFLAQHHGLPTRLLDWTTNPLVAAYFACQPSPNGKRMGEIIAVEISNVGIFSETEITEGPFAIDKTKFIFPTVVAPRISAQRGLFSVHTDPAKNWILRGKTDRHTILADDKASFLDFLFGLGVDAAMVMADLDGLSTNLSWRYQAGRPI